MIVPRPFKMFDKSLIPLLSIINILGNEKTLKLITVTVSTKTKKYLMTKQFYTRPREHMPI